MSASDRPIDILVVEDNPPVRTIMERLLAAEGLVTRGVGSGAEMLAAARDLPSLRLLIVDVQLPDGSGLEFLEQVRKERPELAAILTSGEPLDAALPERTVWMAKPFAPAELRSLAARLVRTGP